MPNLRDELFPDASFTMILILQGALM